MSRPLSTTTRPLFVGSDVGSQSVKADLFDVSSTCLAESAAESRSTGSLLSTWNRAIGGAELLRSANHPTSIPRFDVIHLAVHPADGSVAPAGRQVAQVPGGARRPWHSSEFSRFYRWRWSRICRSRPGTTSDAFALWAWPTGADSYTILRLEHRFGSLCSSPYSHGWSSQC